MCSVKNKSDSGGTFLFFNDLVAKVPRESTVMFSLGTNDYVFQAKKVQNNDILLVGGTLLFGGGGGLREGPAVYEAYRVSVPLCVKQHIKNELSFFPLTLNTIILPLEDLRLMQ